MAGATVPIMDCSSSGSHSQSPVTAGMLARLLSDGDPLPQSYTAASMKLCGHMTVMCTSFSSRHDFLQLLQSINTLEDMVESGLGRDSLEEMVLSCIVTLHCLECYTHRYVVRDSADRGLELAEVLSTHLPIIMGHVQPLECLLRIPSTISGRQQSCACHMTRLSLHIHWSVLSVAYRLAPLVGWRLFLMLSRQSLSSLLSHAASIHTITSISSSLPGCLCTRQLWLFLRHTLDCSAATTATPANAFWPVVSSLLMDTLAPPQPHPSEDNCEGLATISPSDAMSFAWWCVKQVALLYGTSEEGQPLLQYKAHWELVHHLLPLTFRLGTSEVRLRYSLRVCLFLCGIWPPSLLPATQAWDYYYKHMVCVIVSGRPGARLYLCTQEDQLVATGTAIREWTTAEGSSPNQWLQYLLSLFHATDDSTATISELRPPANEANSFQLFLCLVYSTIASGATQKDGGNAVWRQLKGRFYSKLHRRWLIERKEVGLCRVMSLLLTLAWAGCACEVALKAVALLTQIGLGQALDHTPLLWRAVFAMLLLMEKKGEKFDDVIKKLHPAFDSLAKPHPPEFQDSQWRSLDVVLDGTMEVLETGGGISLGAGELIGCHLSDLLTSGEDRRMLRVLGFVESLTTFLTPSSPSSPSSSFPHSAISQLLWQHCSQQLLSLIQLPSPPSTLPSTLAALTALSCHTSHSTPPFTILEEVTRDAVNPTLASLYLSHVIESDITRHHVLAGDRSQIQSLHTWLRCLAVLDHTPSARSSSATPTHSAVVQLTHQLTKLPMVTALLGQQTTPTDPMSLLQLLLEAMETAYLTSDGGGVWRERLTTVLGDLPHYLEPSVSGSRGTGAIRHAYWVAGLVVAKSPRLTYSRTDSRCLLPRLVEWLVLPLPSSRKPLPEEATTAIRSKLHLFLSGLLQLEPQRDDFIRRKVKQLFSRYFHSYCQPPSPLMAPPPNPFLVTLQPWLQDGRHGEQLRLVMDVIASQFLSLPQQPASLSPTLQFIKKVIEKVQSPLLLTAMTPPLLGHMTSCLLACDVCPACEEPPGIRPLVMSILTPLVSACKEHQELLPCSSLLPILSDYVTSHTEVSEVLVTKPLMSIADLYPDLVEQLIPLLGDEKMQSIGHTLQSGLNKLSSHHPSQLSSHHPSQ